jgi:AbiV family abortive infection protein
MDKLETLNKTFQACIENASAHLSAAKELRSSGHNNMAFNAAVLALEEMGKAVLVGMRRGHHLDEESDFIRDDWFDDHSKKLFWALWSTFFGRRTQTLQDFQDFPHVANRIHRRRLDGIYMDPRSTDPPERIHDEDVDGLISLAEYALGTEGRAVFQEVDGKDRADLEWFIQIAEDPKLGGVVFGEDSFARLNSLNGDVRQWVQWLRGKIGRIEEYNRALEEQETNRTSPPEDDALNSKWSVKVRLHSWSHSIRPKPLAFWNKKSQWVKLSTTRDKKEILAEFLVPRKVMMGDLWRVGTTISQAFTLALNVATRGFFWWYLPAPTEEFFEEIRDLGRNVPLGITQPSRVLEWGNHSLSESDLEETGRVYMYLQRIHANESAPYTNYVQALALLAKSDAHGRFEPTALQLFYQSLRGYALQHGDWDGTTPFAEAAFKALDLFRERIVSIDEELPRHIQLGETLSQGRVVENLTVRDTIMMKLFCDLYISRIAHEALGYKWSQSG